ncbi:conjugative transposon protein TraN [Arachidicoccus terrestris]|uniref:conjugative transposon protein TraN n=1 Tax=Arachidicoccus terrestris TaxID=2875539 RepID=UPI001CC37BBF|nr:conjugative transposon protein TraN [Arachidicoccus terrestris]UAY55776.1 conjugative transposon protein TraN [Arachidicoccus terrestris]
MRKWILMTVISIFVSGGLFAQRVIAPTAVSPRCRVAVAVNKTSNIIFPYAIRSVDRGSEGVIAQVVKGFSNILQLKAGDTAFSETNLTVITSDGKFYSFLVAYAADPKVLNLSFRGQGEAYADGLALTDGHNEQALERDAAGILQAGNFLHKSIVSQGMRLRLAGIYLKDDLMWFRLRLTNYSEVAFDLDNTTFSAVDKKQAKRTARQEIRLSPVYSEVVESVEGGRYTDLILAFKPFTLSGAKRLKVRINDKTGGRHLILTLPSRKLLRARTLE